MFPIWDTFKFYRSQLGLEKAQSSVCLSNDEFVIILGLEGILTLQKDVLR